MDRLRRARDAAEGATRSRPRARHLVAAALGAWVVVSLVPLAWTLPPALRVGTAVRRLQGQVDALGSGWAGTINTSQQSKGKGPLAWEWSLGPTSTITIQPSWSAISLELKPIVCADRKRQRIFVSSPNATTVRTLVLNRGFHWYPINLGWLNGSDELTFSYRCVQSTAPIDNGLRNQRPFAVAVAGLVVQRRS